MLKTQLKEHTWIKEENNNEQQEKKQLPFSRKHRKKKKRNFSKTPYCKSCHKYFKNYTVLAVHRQVCLSAKPLDQACSEDEHKPSAKEEQEEGEEKQDEQDNDESEPKSLELLDKLGRFELRPLVTCKDCKLSFATTREIFEHRQYLDCLGSSNDEDSDLSDNTDDEYEYDTLYTCNVCRAKFISAELLKVHRAREQHYRPSEPTPPSSDFIVVKSEIADFTYRSFEDNQYSCTSCINGRAYHDPDDLLKHHRSVHSSDEVYCRYCSEKLGSPAEFSDHHNSYHELAEFCRVCHDKDTDYSDTSVLPPKPVCLECCRRFRMPFEDCLSLLKENLYCDDCERVMPTVGHYRFHNCVKEEDRLLSPAILVCPLCLETYNSLRSLYRHIVRHNDIMDHRCSGCGRLHETWRALQEHVLKCSSDGGQTRLPRVTNVALRKSAEDVIRRFVRNGVTLLI